MPMDPTLAALYGTEQTETEDTEKLAAAKLAEELGEEGSVEELSDEQAEELAQQVLAEEEEGAEVEEPEDEEGQEKVSEAAEEEAQEKLAEADYLGRVMAHAYTQELRKIAEAEPAKKGKIREYAGKAWEATKKAPGQYGRAMRGSGAGGWKGALGAGKGWKRGAQVWGARGGTAAAVGGAGYAAYKKLKGKKKQSAAEPTALDILAERRALQILAENGIDPNAEVETEATEKLSASQEQEQALMSAVERRAFEMLERAGYVQAEEPEQEEEQETEE